MLGLHNAMVNQGIGVGAAACLTLAYLHAGHDLFFCRRQIVRTKYHGNALRVAVGQTTFVAHRAHTDIASRGKSLIQHGKRQFTKFKTVVHIFKHQMKLAGQIHHHIIVVIDFQLPIIQTLRARSGRFARTKRA